MCETGEFAHGVEYKNVVKLDATQQDSNILQTRALEKNTAKAEPARIRVRLRLTSKIWR